ncbi:hypothetical protein NYE70_14715 [Paenibacillus sp. FSL R5-0407]|uniref:hypothetical protein n=1 Tax=Paenibacillus sp. FSL R5-0407 TaxID=2975320 RepID=UPI0030FC12FF
MFEIHDSTQTVDTFMKMAVFSDETKERVKDADIVLLPDFNIKEGVDRAFQPDTVTFFKYSKAKKESQEVKIELFENKGEEKFLALHSFDIWIPTIVIIKEGLFGFVINLVSSYVYDKMKGRPKDEPTVHFQLIVENKKAGKSKKLMYNGPMEGFRDSFEKIDVSKLWED